MTDIRRAEVTHVDGTKGTDRWCNDCGQAFPFPSHRCGSEKPYRLTLDEARLIIEALENTASNANGYEPADTRLIARCRRLVERLREEHRG